MADGVLDDPMREVSKELAAIKRLIILSLIQDGVSQEQIGAAVGLSQSQVSRMFPQGLNLKAKRAKA